MNLSLLRDKKFYLILLWLGFTSVFALWWMQVGLRHVDLLQSLLPDETSHWIGQRRMFFWEGLAWLALLLVGGFTSVYLLYREKRHLEGLKTFFASFNHDVKTSLTSLRLQAEALKEDLEGQPSSEKLLSRLISDTLRLQIQLENSLYMSAQEAQKLLIEEKNLEDFLVSTKHKWPQVEVSWNRGAKVQVDERGFYIVLNNLIQNAWNHGRATSVHFNVQSDGNQKVRIEFQDNGKGFSGSGKKLGKLFFRPTSQSGTGMGLYICGELLSKMNGRLELNSDLSSGFGGQILLPGSLT